MSFSRKNIEITAPAGSFESLRAAIQAGADSVYFGAGGLNMRAKSSFNFTIDDLGEVAKICKTEGMKAYLALNVVVYDEEIESARGTLEAARETGIDAVIATDVSVLSYARELMIPVHASTQLNISNFEALKFYSQFCDVAVLARELNLGQIRNIYDRILKEDLRGPSGNLVRLETFAHGALCMSISGKCFLSLHEKNSSANRGACLQTCRRKYLAADVETGVQFEIDNQYVMSPKDLKTIDFLDELIAAGSRILKIEGRGRAPEYVRTTVECYREAVESIVEESFTKEKIDDWNRRLAEVFNRGFWEGHFLGDKIGERSDRYGSKATRKKVYLGQATNYFVRPKVAAFLVQNGSVSRGDSVLIIGPTTGAVETKLDDIRIDDKPARKAEKGDEFSIRIESKIRRSDKIYKLVDAKTVPGQD